MQVTVEEAGVTERKLNIMIPANRIKLEVDKLLQTKASQIHLPGFRPGKIPIAFIRKRFSEKATGQVIETLISDCFYDALRQQQINFVGLVRIEPINYESGSDLAYSAIVSILPEFPEINLSGTSITKLVCDIGDEDVDRMIHTLREMHPLYQDKDGPAEPGDRVVIDYDAHIDGASFIGSQVRDFTMNLGYDYHMDYNRMNQNRLEWMGRLGMDVDPSHPRFRHPDFPHVFSYEEMLEPIVQGVIGACDGETRTIACTFPSHFDVEGLVGKGVEFKVTIKLVQHLDLSKIDDELAKKYNVEDGNLASLRAEIQASMERELKRIKLRHSEAQVLNAIEKKFASIELPKAMVNSEIDLMIAEKKREFLLEHESNRIPSAIFNRDGYVEEAKQMVKFRLIFREIVSQQEFEVNNVEIDNRIKEMAQEYEDPDAYTKDLRNYYADPVKRSKLGDSLMTEKIIEYLAGTADIEELNIDFAEFTRPSLQDSQYPEYNFLHHE